MVSSLHHPLQIDKQSCKLQWGPAVCQLRSACCECHTGKDIRRQSEFHVLMLCASAVVSSKVGLCRCALDPFEIRLLQHWWQKQHGHLRCPVGNLTAMATFA